MGRVESLKKLHPQDPGIQGLPKTEAGSGQLLPPHSSDHHDSDIIDIYDEGWGKSMKREPKTQAHRKGLKAKVVQEY